MHTTFIRKARFLWAMLFMLVACNQASPTPKLTDTDIATIPLPTLTHTLSPTYTLRPPSTPRPTRTPRFVLPPTAVPLAANDPFQIAVQKGEKEVLYSTSIIGPQDAIYSVYVLMDAAYDPLNYGLPGYDSLNSCILVFYRLQRQVNSLMTVMNSSHPVACILINWNQPLPWAGVTLSPGEDTKLLGLDGYWSDINQNGLPEVAVIEQYCANACLNWGIVKTRFYEIQSESKIVDITGNISGAILPWNIINTTAPLTIKVYDPIEYEHHVPVEVDWIYQWNGHDFENVTVRHKVQYESRVDEIEDSLQRDYGKPLAHYAVEFLEILTIYERADLPRDEGLALFLEITDLSHWPNTEKDVGCWLQVARAYVQEEFNKTRTLDLPPSPNYLYLGPIADFSKNLAELGIADYDLSLCK